MSKGQVLGRFASEQLTVDMERVVVVSQIRVLFPAPPIYGVRAEISDDRNHMVVSVNYDTDIGDAWEFADVPYYPEAMTALAYRYGINYIIYSMTH